METVWKNKNTCLFKNANAFLSHGIKEHNSKIWLYAAILLVCLKKKKSNYTLKLLMLLTLYSTDENFKTLLFVLAFITSMLELYLTEQTGHLVKIC